MVDHQLLVAVDVEASRPDVDGYTKAADQRLILRDVVGRGEAEANRILEFTSL